MGLEPRRGLKNIGLNPKRFKSRPAHFGVFTGKLGLWPPFSALNGTSIFWV